MTDEPGRATEQDRTADLTITNRLLYHLSYGGLFETVAGVAPETGVGAIILVVCLDVKDFGVSTHDGRNLSLTAFEVTNRLQRTKKEGVSGRVEGARKLPRDSRGTPSKSSIDEVTKGGTVVKSFFL